MWTQFLLPSPEGHGLEIEKFFDVFVLVADDPREDDLVPQRPAADAGLLEAFLQTGPHHDIQKVKYFTARVSGTPADPSMPQRQDVYLRALRRYRPEVEVYFGHFLSHRIRAPLVLPVGDLDQRTVEIVRTEEKGSNPETPNTWSSSP